MLYNFFVGGGGVIFAARNDATWRCFYFFAFYLLLLYRLYMAPGFYRGGGRETKNNIFYGCCGFGLSCGGGCGQFR